MTDPRWCGPWGTPCACPGDCELDTAMDALLRIREAHSEVCDYGEEAAA